jgi:PAS domain S-box-containing protein
VNGSFGRETAHHVRLLVDQVPSMLAYWDRDLRCRFANRAYERWFGVDPDAIVGMSIRDLLGPELFALNEPFIRAALDGREQVFERIIPGRGGVDRHSLATYVPDLVDGEVLGFVAHVAEVTHLKVAEAALRAEIAQREHTLERLHKSERALREAQRLGRVGSWEWEIGPDITIWSEELYRMFGRDPQHLPPTYAEHPALYTEESWKRLQSAVSSAAQSGQPYLLELEYVRVDGERGWLEARGEAVRGDSGEITGLRGTVHDITARYRAQQARLEAQAVDASSRHKAEVMARFSHELRTPLNAILGFAQLLHGEAALEPRHRKWAHMISQSGAQMLELVDDILELSAARRTASPGAPAPAASVESANDAATPSAAEWARLVAIGARYRAIVEAQAEMLSLAEPDGTLVYVNPAYGRHFGRSPDEMIGMNLYDQIPQVERDAVRGQIEAVLRNGDVAYGENRLVGPDGSERWIGWTNLRLSDEGGRPLLHSVGRDITERKCAEAAAR